MFNECFVCAIDVYAKQELCSLVEAQNTFSWWSIFMLPPPEVEFFNVDKTLRWLTRKAKRFNHDSLQIMLCKRNLWTRRPWTPHFRVRLVNYRGSLVDRQSSANLLTRWWLRAAVTFARENLQLGGRSLIYERKNGKQKNAAHQIPQLQPSSSWAKPQLQTIVVGNFSVSQHVLDNQHKFLIYSPSSWNARG